MRLLANKRLATRISIITTAITLIGMLFLWIVVSTNTASMVKNHITNQMTDAVEARAAIINEYVASAEEYMSAFASCSSPPRIPRCWPGPRSTPRPSPPSRVSLRASTSPHQRPTC